MRKIFWFLPAAVFAFVLPGRAANVFLTINGSLQQKTPAAVVIQGQGEYTAEFVQTLASDLDLSGWFKVNRAAAVPKVDYAALLNPSGEGQVIAAGKMSSAALEIKVFNVSGGQVLYAGNFVRGPDARYLAHTVNDAIVWKLTGKPGIATSRIAYTYVTPAGRRELKVCDYDGADVSTLLAPDFTVGFPVWFPDDKRLLYLSYRTGFPALEELNPSSGSAKRLVYQPGLNACASFFWQKKQFAAVLSKSGSPEIYVFNFNGEILRKITHYNGINASPCVSPDDKQIVFVSDRRGRPVLWTCDVWGFGLRQLDVGWNYVQAPQWSPDGNFLVYVVRENGRMVIGLYDFRTGNSRLLTGNFSWCDSPSWAPDSRHIVFSRMRNYKNSLWIMDVYTGETRLLVRDGETPSWTR